MTGLHEVFVLDVGHGNCTILRSDEVVSVMDAPTKSILLDTLRQLEIKNIDAIFVSHSDKDHIAGVGSLLSSNDVTVKSLYLNPDSTKGPGSPWHDLRVLAADARNRYGLTVYTALTTDSPKTVPIGSATVEVLAPTPEFIMGGAGSVDLGGKHQLNSNSVSVVLRIKFGGKPLFLLPGDLDSFGLDAMTNELDDASAEVLLFPHHGGLPGSTDPEVFARKVCQLVSPKVVIFSNSRTLYSNPRPEIVKGVRSVSTAVVACTELSKQCCESTDGINYSHLASLPAYGHKSAACCAGTMRFCLKELTEENLICLAKHSEFVEKQIVTAICKR